MHFKNMNEKRYNFPGFMALSCIAIFLGNNVKEIDNSKMTGEFTYEYEA